MVKWNDKRLIFLYVVVLIGIFFLWKFIGPVVLFKNVKMSIIKQNGTIDNLDAPRVSDFSEEYYINTINFPDGSVLHHKDLGNFGYSADFFINFQTRVEVLKSGLYIFQIASDDGFRFFINTNIIGEFLTNRPFATNQYTVMLNKGLYDFYIDYYQGYGLLGVTAKYQHNEDSRSYYIGENSPYFRFLRK